MRFLLDNFLRWIHREDSGSVTAEFAVIIPVVLSMVALLLSLTRAVVVRVECQQAASAGARVAVAESNPQLRESRARKAIMDVAGSEVKADITSDDSSITVVTHCPVGGKALSIVPVLLTGKAIGVLQ